MPVRSITRPRIHSRRRSRPSRPGGPVPHPRPWERLPPPCSPGARRRLRPAHPRTPGARVHAAQDDQILCAARNEQLATVHEAEIARVQPAVDQRLPGRGRVSEVPLHHGGSRTKIRPPLTSMSMPGSGAPAEASSRPPATQVRRPRPVGVNATAREASESPYTGIIARLSKPLGANRSEKRRNTAGRPAPRHQRESQDEITPSSPGRAEWRGAGRPRGVASFLRAIRAQRLRQRAMMPVVRALGSLSGRCVHAHGRGPRTWSRGRARSSTLPEQPLPGIDIDVRAAAGSSCADPP